MSNWWRHLFPREIPSDWQKISDSSDFKSLTSGFCAERKILFFLWYFGLSILQFGLQILILPLHTASPTLDPRSICPSVVLKLDGPQTSVASWVQQKRFLKMRGETSTNNTLFVLSEIQTKYRSEISRKGDPKKNMFWEALSTNF